MSPHSDDKSFVPVGRLLRRSDDGPPAETGSVGRRTFLGMGLGSVLSSFALTGCIRKPKENILPYARRPEDLVPGKPRYYATSAFVAGGAIGLLVESQDGRPTKIEGNPKHPSSGGSSSAWVQAEVLNLYDTDRAQKPALDGKDVTWEQAWAWLDGVVSKDPSGARMAVLAEPVTSPTLDRLMQRLRDKFPQVLFAVHRPVGDEAVDGHKLVGMDGLNAIRHYDRADVVVTLDADILGVEPDAVRTSRLVAQRRRLVTEQEDIGRIYSVEPAYTVTGSIADNRLRLPASQVAAFVAALATELVQLGLALPEGAKALQAKLAKADRSRFGAWVPAVAKDLIAHSGKSILVAGYRQPATVHALVCLLNEALGNVGETITYGAASAWSNAMPLADLAKRIEMGSVDALIVLGGNPCYDAPADLKLPALLAKVASSVHVSMHRNETSALCKLQLPQSHFLEAWGDLRALDGTVSVQQPLIAPLYDTVSDIEVLARLAGEATTRGYELVRATWAVRYGGPASRAFERKWRRWLHDGVTDMRPMDPRATPKWERLDESWPAELPAAPSANALELGFALDASTYDGRYANNGWMQEAPDPTTKLTWDNAAYVSKATAESLGVATGDVVRVKVGGAALEIPVLVLPGMADHTLILPLGYGRRAGGTIAKGVGFDTYALRSTRGEWIATGATLERTGRTHKLASTQEHDSMENRPILRETTMEAHRKEPHEIAKVEGPPLESLWTEPNARGGQQWGMSIDLSSCTGCNACVIACQAENNIPVVGKEQVLNGREMHWIRVDRYFGGDDGSTMATQPMACTHCENAPCESVCPVAATVHSPEGLNDMAYNRCIGTRYCSNNCPLKVRRFNFFNYNHDIEPVEALQKNPDVTVRFRGVMEKCTYCVQRINEQKIKAKRDGDGVVPDRAIVTACEQACPTQAIVFGDVNEPGSRVSALKKQSRDYSVLAELNIKPRTTYLAKVRNPNPELV